MRKLKLVGLSKIRQIELLTNFILFFFGFVVNFISYFSLNPFFSFFIFLILGRLLISIFFLNGLYEIKMYYRIAYMGWLMSGIAAIYVVYFKDNYQLYSDAGDFFNLTINKEVSTVSLIEIQGFFENALPIYIWNSIYNGFNFLGFPKERYIGVFFNTIAVSLSGVFTIKIARLIFFNDIVKLQRLIYLFSFCGLFWLFSSIHLRDSLVLLIVTILTFFWVLFLKSKITTRNVLLILVANLSSYIIFRFLRAEFTFVPIAFFLSAMFAKYLSQVRGKKYFLKSFMFSILIILFIGIIIKILGQDLIETVVNGYISYNEGSEKSNSLGNTLIVNQILPLRLIFGFIYLFVFPIPFWSGFQLESAYHLFLTFNVLYFYYLTPLFILSIVYFFKFKSTRRTTLIFIFFISIGFTFAISLTSLETRHFGCFLPSILVFSLIPDLEIKKHDLMLKLYLKCFLVIIFSGHLCWYALKFIL